MDLKNFSAALSQIAEEKGLSPEKIIETIEQALAAAYKKDYGKKGQVIRAKLNPTSGEAEFWQVKLAVDKDMIYSEEEIEELRPEKTKDGKIVFVADKIVSTLTKNKERPVVFASTVAPQRMEGYELRMRGMVFEIAEGNVDIEATKALFHSTFKLDNTLSAAPDSINIVIEKMIINYHAALFKLVDALLEEQRNEEALREIQFAKSFPEVECIVGYVPVKEAAIQYKLKDQVKGDAILEELLDKRKNATIINMVAETYYENDRKEHAIAVLADWLKEHPDDKEILKKLSEYGEEE